jgi:hypothetical protein
MLEEYMLRANIDRYKDLLRNPVDEIQRCTLEQLLAEAMEKLRVLMSRTIDDGPTQVTPAPASFIR